jgi:hypothetical protein
MQIPLVGPVTKDERFDWLYSTPMPLKVFGNKEIRIVLEGYEEDGNQQDFHLAISTFLSIGEDVLIAAEPHVFNYYRDINEYLAPSDEGYVGINTPSEVWDHVQVGEEAFVGRRPYGDKGIYVSIECNCDWEPEHGLQIVFKNGKSVCKVGPYDGHITNADAYADEQLENVVYRLIGS